MRRAIFAAVFVAGCGTDGDAITADAPDSISDSSDTSDTSGGGVMLNTVRFDPAPRASS